MGKSKWVEKLPSKTKNRVIKELVEGQEFAFQLKSLLLQTRSGEERRHSVSAQDLAWKIMRSFSESISVLSSCDPSDQASQSQAASDMEVSRCSSPRRLEESGESRKRPAPKERRGCYKRKKSAETWTKVSSTMEDGYAWRKYGQKVILNSKHPRSYFRCSRKHDQGCKATKQVQRMEEDPQKFRTIYTGTHTCRDTAGASALRMVRDDSPDSTENVDQISRSSPEKQEDVGEEKVDPIMWKDLVSLEMGPDHGEVVVVSGLYSCMDSNYQGFELPFDFDASELHFE